MADPIQQVPFSWTAQTLGTGINQAVTATQAGTSLVCVVAAANVSTIPTALTVTDNKGNTWVKRVTKPSSTTTRLAEIYDCLSPASTGVTQVTVTPTGGTGANYGSACFFEIPAATFDSSGSVYVGVSVNPTAAITAAGADAGTTDFVVAGVSMGDGSTNNLTLSNPGTGNSQAYTTALRVTDESSTTAVQIDYRRNSASYTDAISWSFTGNADGVAVLASYNGPSSLAGPADGANPAIRAPAPALGTPLRRFRGPILDTGTTPRPFIDQTAGSPPRRLGLGTPWSRLRFMVPQTRDTPPPFIDQTAGDRPKSMRLGTPRARLRTPFLDTGTTPNTGTTIALTGVSTTVSPGTLGVNVDTALTGVTGSFSAGTVTPNTTAAGDQTAWQSSPSLPYIGTPVSRWRGRAGLDTSSPVTAVSQALTGVTATGSAGTVIPSVTIALTGATITSSAGTLAASFSVALTGVSSTVSPGSLGVNVDTALTAVAATFSAGTVIPSTGVTLALTGVSSTLSAGDVGVNVDTALTGLTATFTAGTVTPTSGTVVALTGVSSTVSAGSLGVSVDTALTGVSAAIAAGNIVVQGDTTGFAGNPFPAGGGASSKFEFSKRKRKKPRTAGETDDPSLALETVAPGGQIGQIPGHSGVELQNDDEEAIWLLLQ